MLQKKICLLGASAVGKTSLVSRFVRSIFSERYLSTIGVKIDKRLVHTDGGDVNLVIWDIEGEREFRKVQSSYLTGSSGCILVADGTRPETLETALALRDRVVMEVGAIPFALALNKADLEQDWRLTPGVEEDVRSSQLSVHQTSARTGTGVERLFQSLAEAMVPGD